MYLTGTDISCDYAQARHWLSLAAQDRHPAALRALGEMHLHGKGVMPSIETATDFLKDAGELGDKEATKLLNEINATELPEIKRAKTTGAQASGSQAKSSKVAGTDNALKALKAAATAGQSDAMLQLGDYFRNLGTQSGLKLAQSWYQKAKEANQPEAPDRLGDLHLAKARRLLEEAVHNFLIAMTEGNQTAEEWCENNDTCCTSIKVAMAERYLNIRDRRRNRKRAIKLLTSAGDDGDPKAKNRLSQLRSQSSKASLP